MPSEAELMKGFPKFLSYLSKSRQTDCGECELLDTCDELGCTPCATLSNLIRTYCFAVAQGTWPPKEGYHAQ